MFPARFLPIGFIECLTPGKERPVFRKKYLVIGISATMTLSNGHEIQADDLHQQIHELVKLIEQTEFANPLDDDVITDRRIYRACLDWRVNALIDESLQVSPG